MNGILTDRLNDVYSCTDLASAKAMVLDIVQNSNIRAQDRARMLITVNRCESLIGLQKYITNSWFAFNGMRVK